jgi:hypothetical protein
VVGGLGVVDSEEEAGLSGTSDWIWRRGRGSSSDRPGRGTALWSVGETETVATLREAASRRP